MMETNIKVNMNGKDYVKFLQNQAIKKQISNKKFYNFIIKHKIEIIFGTAAFILLICVVTMPQSPSVSIFEKWANISWGALLKIGFCVVLISWLLHGVKIRLLA